MATNAIRVEVRAELLTLLAETLAHHEIGPLSAKLEAAGLPYAPIMRPDQLIDDPHLKASGGLVKMPTEDGAETDVVLLPLLMNGRRPGVRRPLPRWANTLPKYWQSSSTDRDKPIKATETSHEPTFQLTRRALVVATAASVLTPPPTPRLVTGSESPCRKAASRHSPGRPGSGVDTIIRAAAPALSKSLGQPAVVREPDRRRRHHRYHRHHQGSAGWSLTIGVVSNNHVVNPSVVQEDAVRRHQRHHADLRCRGDAVRAGREPAVPAKNAKELAPT